MRPTDQELIERAKRGDNAAFGQIWERHEPGIRALCHRILQSGNADPAADAQDLTAETFIQALHALDQFQERDGTDRGFGRWLQEIARRRCIKWLERQRRRVELLKQHPEATPPSAVAHQVEQREVLRRAAQEINALPATYRLPFRLMLEQYSHREIAQSLGISPEAVVQRIYRARLRLRPLLTPLLEADTRKHLVAMEQALSEIVVSARIITLNLPSGGELQLCVRVDQRLARQEVMLAAHREALHKHPRAWKPYLAFAELCYHCGLWEEACAAYEETLRRNPTCLRAALDLWEMLQQQKKGEQALSLLESALAHQSSLSLQAILLEARGKSAEASDAYRAALKDSPQERVLYYGLNRTLGLQSRYHEQLEILQKLREVAPDDLYGYDSAYVPSARLRLWESLSLLMERAIQLDPNNPQILKHLFQVRMNQHRYDDETLACAERLVRLAPDFVASWSELAWIYAVRGRHEESLAVLHHFLEQHPRNADAHAALAWRYHYLDRGEECISHARSAYALDPTDYHVCWTIAVAYKHVEIDIAEVIPIAQEIETRFWDDAFILSHVRLLLLERGQQQRDDALSQRVQLLTHRDV